ncbi:MAG: ribosome maturation factor RimM [Thermoanaerobaculia bacterium]
MSSAHGSRLTAHDTASMLLVGTVRRPHGLRGEVSVEVATDFPERFVPGSILTWSAGVRQCALTLRSARRHGARMLMCFEGVPNLEAARELAGGELCIPVKDAVPAPEDFYYSHEVDGWSCLDIAGKVLGVARGLAETAAGPLLSVETLTRKETLVPFVRPIVVSVDRAERRIVLDLPEGLLEL